MKVCCMFNCKTASEADSKAINNLYVVEEYGSFYNHKMMHTSDSGERWLSRCKECGAYVLVQESSCWSLEKDYYDYFPVDSIEHARKLNELYDGYDIETRYHCKKLFITNGEAAFIED